MTTISDVLALDWHESSIDFPEGFQPLDAILLVKGVYPDDDGSLTRPVWCQRWTMALSRNVSERVGQLRVAAELALQEALAEYDDE